MRNGFAVPAIASLALVFVGALVADSQEARPLTVEEAMGTHSFTTASHISLSRDGRWLAYSVRDNRRMISTNSDGDERERLARTGVFAENEGTDIWIVEVATGTARRLTGGQGANWDPSWSPDGRYLAFLSDRDGSGQARAWIWNASEDRLQLLSAMDVRSGGDSPAIEWTPDSRSILLCTRPGQMTPKQNGTRTEGAEAQTGSLTPGPSGSTAVVYTARRMENVSAKSTRASRVNLDTLYLRDLALVDVGSGKAMPLSDGQRIGWYSLSPNGSHAAYLVVKGLHPVGTYRRVYDLVSVDLATGKKMKLAEDALIADIFGWSPNSAQIVFFENAAEKNQSTMITVPAGGGPQERVGSIPRAIGSFVLPAWDESQKKVYMVIDGNLWRIDIQEKVASEFATIPGYRIVRRVGEGPELLWSADGGKSTVVVAFNQKDKHDAFYAVDLTTGEAFKQFERGECIDCLFKGSSAGARLVAATQNVVAFIAEDAQHAPDLWVSDPEFHHVRPLTHLNPQFDEVQMGIPRLVDWLGLDGEIARGVLLLPPDYQPGRRYPLIALVYPTTLTNNFDQFSFGVYPGPLNLHLFATRGYAVFLPDVRKSFMDMSAMSATVLLGINEMVRLGIADPDRIGVMGHSAGGYETLALVVASRRFRAAVDMSGIGDLLSLYGLLSKDGSAWESDDLVEQLGGAPWQKPLLYLQNSPMYFLDRVESPLLIAHGSEDGSVPPETGEEIFVGLRQLGKEVEYVRYQGESHVPSQWSYTNQSDLCQRVLDWFTAHLGDGSKALTPTK
jgi:dipeptidyl aminopeptidase/acylaminoacyl peptidase